MHRRTHGPPCVGREDNKDVLHLLKLEGERGERRRVLRGRYFSLVAFIEEIASTCPWCVLSLGLVSSRILVVLKGLVSPSVRTLLSSPRPPFRSSSSYQPSRNYTELRTYRQLCVWIYIDEQREEGRPLGLPLLLITLVALSPSLYIDTPEPRIHTTRVP